MFPFRKAALIISLALAMAACETKVESPRPEATALDPSLACGEQLTTPIRVDGTHLSPLPIDTLTDNPALQLPDLWVQRTADLRGNAVEEAPVDLDESEAAGRVRWLSQREMSFDVFPELGLEPGLYTFYAQNADGQTTELASAITIVPRPTLESIVPNIVCGEQHDNAFTLTGTMFVQVDGRVPTVTIGGVDLTPSELTDCFDLPGPAGARACTTMVATLPADTLAPSIVAVTVTNPEPAGCESTDSVLVEIVPPPSVASIEPPLACLEQSDRTFLVSGSDFLVLEQGGDDVFPTVSVGDVDVTPDAVADCSELLGPAPGRRCTELTITLPAASLDPGLQPVFVTNPEPAHCVSEEDVELEVVPPPTLLSIEPALVCSEQLTNTLTLTGTDFIVVPDGESELLPDVSFSEALTLTATAAGGCVDLPGTLGAESCTELTVVIDPEALSAGIYDITVTNPPPAGCTSTQPVRFEVIPPPTVSAIAPTLACLAQGERAFELTGTGFLVLEGETDTPPDVVVGVATATVSASADCVALEGPVAGRLCTSLTVSLAADGLTPGLHGVVVTNPAPAACETTETVELEVIPPPTVAAIDPILACVEGADRSFALTGTGLLVIEDGESDLFPTVTVGSLSVEAEADNADCQDLAGTQAGRLCTGLTFTLPAGGLAAGDHTVSVTNPPPGGCTSVEDTVELEVVPPATVSTVTPGLVCGSQFENVFTVTGEGFLVFPDGDDSLLPSVRLGDHEAVVDSADGCSDRSDSAFGGRACTELTFTLPAEGTAAGVHTAVIVNPAPADCASTDPVEVQVLGEPVVTSLVPAGLCAEYADTVLRINGTGFLSLGDTVADWPSVQFGDQSFDPTGLDGCVALTGPVEGELCTAIDVLLVEGAFDAFDEVVVVTNPPIAACASDSETGPAVEEVPPPTITGFEPEPVCDDAVTFAILGSDFQEGATVDIADSDSGAPVTVDSATVVLGDPDRIDVVVPEPLLAGLYDVTVTNPDSCDDTATDFLEVVTGPFLFNIDPPVAYSEIRTLVTLYVAGVRNSITEVWVVEDATDVRTDLTFNFDPEVNENLVFAELPAGTFSEGSYTVFINDETDCPDFLEGVLFIESDLTVAVGPVDPPFAWTEEDTAVDIRTKDPVPDGEVLFQDVPRVYLSPVADDGTVARLLRSVSFRDETRLTAVVPAGLPPGAYDVVVVNPAPDNTIGVADDPFIVTDVDSPPPLIDFVTPARIAASSDAALTIRGDHFRNDAVVTYECQPPGGGDTFTVDGPGGATILPTTITTVMPASTAGLTQGTVCVVQVTQSATAGDDLTIDTRVEYSAISVISPSGNLFSLGSGPELETPRRTPAVAAGRITNVARVLYAIGGDDPAPPGGGGPVIHSSIEVAPLDRFGNLEEWDTLDDPMRLPTSGPASGDGAVESARTRSGVARIGRFIYLAGGQDAAGPVDTVIRAQILDPLASPRPDSVRLDLGDAECDPEAQNCGLPPGTLIYRVAALFGNDDLVNPNGESLTSDPFVVRVPDLNPNDDDDDVPNQVNLVQLTISWDPVPRAAGYRVYRSPVPGAASGTEEFLGDVVDPSIFDDGLPTVSGSEHAPLRVGGLGEWAVVSRLPGDDAADAARDAPCVTWGLDPDDPGFAYLYVAGGSDGIGQARDEITVLPIELVSSDVQVLGEPFSSFNALTDARYECGGFSVDSWMYFGSGRVSASSTVASTQSGRVVGSGECDALQATCEEDESALCDGDWTACLGACGGDAGCEAGCDAAYDSCLASGEGTCGTEADTCNAAFPAGELVCQGDIGALAEPCLIGVASRANAAYGVASTGAYLFMFGGTRPNGDPDDRIFESEVEGPPGLGSWTPSGSVDLGAPRRFPGTAQESGFIFIVGGEIDTGTSFDTTATTGFTL